MPVKRLLFYNLFSIINRLVSATVAQSVERLIRNQQVAGSSPASSSMIRRLSSPFGNLESIEVFFFYAGVAVEVKMFHPIDAVFMAVSLAFIVGAYAVKQKTLYILFQTISNLVLIVNYIYLRSLSSVLVVTVATVRFIVFYALVKRYDDVPWIAIILFSFAAGVLGVATAQGPIDYLFVAAVMLYTACYKVRRLLWMKIALLAPLSMMLVYSLLMQAYSGIISQALEIVVIFLQAASFLSKREDPSLIK